MDIKDIEKNQLNDGSLKEESNPSENQDQHEAPAKQDDDENTVSNAGKSINSENIKAERADSANLNKEEENEGISSSDVENAESPEETVESPPHQEHPTPTETVPSKEEITEEPTIPASGDPEKEAISVEDQQSAESGEKTGQPDAQQPAPENAVENAVREENTESEKQPEPEPKNEKQEVEDKLEDEEEHEVQLDYSHYSKKQLVQVLQSMLKQDDFSKAGRILKEVKKAYDELAKSERDEAYEKYIEEGGEPDGFEYRQDELDIQFNDLFSKVKGKKDTYFNSLERQKEQNLKLKNEILEKLRELVDAEETDVSIKKLKDLQQRWKEVGSIPPSQAKSLWANYNALIDRFYDKRSIYFELKELDRKKNLEEKLKLCEKAEQLIDEENIHKAIKQLNELHEEFKHIGPVPKEEQEDVWQRFKAASDRIYLRRKEYFEKLKQDLKLNQAAKEALVEKVAPFAEFDSDRISDWNTKTKEILSIQKEWESIGSLPKDKAKNINKQFWTAFKTFFNKKGKFFKKLEEDRQKNMKLKQELIDKAEALKDSDDFRNTAEELKNLQKKWKEIGPVPEKYRNEVYMKFKKACDHFFDRKRANSGQIEKEYTENLKKKEQLCEELEQMGSSDKVDLGRIDEIMAAWNEIGFVPKANIRSIQKRYVSAIEQVVNKTDMTETEKHRLRFSAQFNKLNYGPGAEKMLMRKEGALRRKISALENDINLWRNNLDFFTSSKNAEKLKKEFQAKIDKATEELKNLKEQLRFISNI